ncbi:MAG TPA: AraC family transcriptional regulator [Draconibacterium sp.]|nr:AraC family transcriptional regulator [Draconibacterium sp.]
MNINIKNMVCNRCIMVVGQIFKNAGIEDTKVQLGKVTVESDISEKQLEQITQSLNSAGFEIINNRTVQLVEQIKTFAINYIYNNTDDRKLNFSTFLSSEMNLDYKYLSTLFSSVENISIEHYMINLKVERVKELLVYDEKTLSEIAHEMGYSSVAHLSGQFKKVTGFTPSYFKNLGEQKRKSISEI